MSRLYQPRISLTSGISYEEQRGPRLVALRRIALQPIVGLSLVMTLGS
jgi:hypothetical protein